MEEKGFNCNSGPRARLSGVKKMREALKAAVVIFLGCRTALPPSDDHSDGRVGGPQKGPHINGLARA